MTDESTVSPSAPLTPTILQIHFPREINCGRMRISTIRQRRVTATRYARVEETFPRRSIVVTNDERSAIKRDREKRL